MATPTIRINANELFEGWQSPLDDIDTEASAEEYAFLLQAALPFPARVSTTHGASSIESVTGVQNSHICRTMERLQTERTSEWIVER